MKKTYKVLVNLKTIFFKYLGGTNAGATIKTIDFNGNLIFLTVSWLTQTLKIRHQLKIQGLNSHYLDYRMQLKTVFKFMCFNIYSFIFNKYIFNF